LTASEVRKSGKFYQHLIKTIHFIRIMDYPKRHFLSIKEVSNLLGISVSTINSPEEKGTFPPKHKLSAQ